ncbi:MAG: hypothetical protein GY913_04310 [Proteobacteria bacterium]|nr:hypothetical protein [Pseudomonadota bacterium]
MSGRAFFFKMAGASGLLLAPVAVAWACSCPSWVSEERFYTVSSLTQIDGTGEHADAELERWAGKAKMTAGVGDSPASVELWLRVHDEGSVRNVRIVGEAAEAQDTGDTGLQGGTP